MMDQNKRIRKDEFLGALPPDWPQSLRQAIKEQVNASQTKVVVLDDDPTGTQTVHGVSVLTEWSVENLGSALQDDAPTFYILTNSRSLPLSAARSMTVEIAQNLQEAAARNGSRYVVVSRSDSTLRGHFPGELEALAEGLSQEIAGWLVVPFFLEGGRYTIHDVHYVDEQGWLVPAAQTDFARDKVFGYSASNLRQWVEEKTHGRVSAKEVHSISIEDLREAGPNQVTERLMDLHDGRVCIVNAASYRDLEVFVLGLLRAEALGCRFLYRTAASFVQVRAGLSPRPLLSREDLALGGAGGGLTVVGSHVQRSTRQLHELLRLPGIVGIEMDVGAVLDDRRNEAETDRVLGLAEKNLQKGKDVVVYTSRKLITGLAEENLSIGSRVSEALTSLVRRLSKKPRYLVAKGGITASDVATKGLGVRKALVLGQIMPGVPVWRLGQETRFHAVPYVVFPGNVGSPRALADAVGKMRKQPTAAG
jgi:uncharacterized protein YgbK (DUF1537 family)